MAYDGHLCCIHATSGFNKVAKLPHRNKPGDKGKFLP
jgi:hypothetical protein